eukprot:4724903-Pyramimonas_sp.AAC.1
MDDDEDTWPGDYGDNPLGHAHSLVSRLNLSGIMGGMKRGNQKRRAREMLEKLDPIAEAVAHGILKSHLQLVDVAERLTAKVVLATSPNDESVLMDLLEKMVKAK